jgi:hypothetical protein
MKRYRILGFDFDSRAFILSEEIREHWEEDVKQQWRVNKDNVRQGLIYQYGEYASEVKIRNFADLGVKPFSVLAFHNAFLTHCRNAFTIGAYYPALTGACALGERILNHLILLLREDYRGTEEYRRVFRKDSFDNWNLAIDALTAWKVLLPGCSDDFKELAKLRNSSIHFCPETDTNDRPLALEAITLLQRIVGNQFSSFGTQPWFIQTIPGESYIKKSWEENPFIKKVYLPNCELVGPKHKLDVNNGKWIVLDNHEYEDTQISDDEFCNLRLNKK